MIETIFDESREQAEETAAQKIASEIFHLSKRQEKIVLGLCGGTSVPGIYRRLAAQEIPWGHVHFFLADDRLAALEHPDSNFLLVKKNFLQPLLSRGKITEQQIHPFVFEPKRPDVSLIAYMDSLKDNGGIFDVIIVSSGEDGHIGALFPNHHSVFSDAGFFILMDDSPKEPALRLTASRRLLLQSKAGFIVFFGEGKRQAYKNFHDEDISIEQCPAKIVAELPKCFVITDIKV